MEQYTKTLQEKDYCDESELFIAQYNNLKHIELNQELAFIHKWAEQNSENALLITGQPQIGKKTLLCSFLKESKKAHPDWLHLAHFASITPIYSNILYKIMIQLRNHFKIQQKVDLNEEKLRRYFKYWLQITSEFLQKEYLGYNKNEVPKVVIVLEGVDSCVDLKGNLVEHKFWLPSRIPPNIKLIITTKSDSQIIQNCMVLHHYMSQERKEKIIKKCCEKTHHLMSKYSNQKLYNLVLIEKMVVAKPQFKVSGHSFEQVFKNYINCIADSSLSEQQIKSLLYTLTLTRKGLKFKWIQKIINISYEKWQLFCKYFDFFIVQTYGYFIICNPKARNLIQLLVDPYKEKVKTYRNSIIRSIKNESLHLRGLEELVYQLLLTQNFSELKEVICRVENFIMLYTPFSKELLCQCWVRLQQLQQFDPVFEYNKAIQAYSSHYYPKEEDLYKIIFQICIFFKEYAQFQNAKTPKFRHPLIKGEVGHLQEIGIYDELKVLQIVGKCKIYKLKPLQNTVENIFSKLKKTVTVSNIKKEVQKSLQTDKAKDKSKSPMAKPQKKNSNKQLQKKLSKKELAKTKNIKQQRRTQKLQKSGSPEDTSQNQRPSTSQVTSPDTAVALQMLNVEELNVGIVSNQQKFKQFFTQQMKQYLENYFAPLKKNVFKDRQLAFESQESDNEEESIKNKQQKQFRVDIEKLKDSLILKKYKEYLEEDYHKNGEQVSYYYYKQWIWLQFPWLCQTVKHIYSQMISECLPGSIHFMSPIKEFSLIRQVLRITKMAKQTKLGIYTDKKIEILPIKNPQFRLEKLKKNDEKQSSMCLTKRSRLQTEQSKKYKVNLNKIQNYLLTQKQYENKLLEKSNGLKSQLKGQASMPSLNMFVTQNQVIQSRLLPNIKKSNFTNGQYYIKREKLNNNQNSRDYTMIIRKFNELKHDNEILVQKIEEMKRLQMQSVDKNQEEMEKINSNIGSLEEKQVSLQKNLSNQQELSKKLQIILKICDLNKMYGSQTDYLSTYLDSLKQMIGFQELKTKKVKDNITEMQEKAKIHIKMLKDKRRQLKSLKDQNSAFNNLASDSTNPQGIHLQFEQIQKELKEMNKSMKAKSKKTKLKESHYLSEKDYYELQESMDIKFGDPKNQKKIQDFADQMQKLKMLKLKKADLSQEYARLQKLLYSKKSGQKNDLQCKEKGKIQLAGLLVQRRKHLSELKNRSQLLQNALQSLANPTI